MSNCSQYKEYLNSYQESLEKLKKVYQKFQETGNLELEESLDKLKIEVREKRKKYEDFAFEEIEGENILGNEITKERIHFDLEKINLNENTSWKSIKILSKIPNIEINLTYIKQEYKERLTS